ncbi:hypothetical protein M8C21_012034 [Ambrosia artemisiifolia]|uniref:Uncharacterized protein n=1 Tax=Ambrosia artemisiifolia TaxID=4212 RepID=A0AAD5GID5_AMBAR|nr:hypothetical protein M8C21_012034 [Ambrosia artemisiifolia]
MERFNLVEGSG